MESIAPLNPKIFRGVVAFTQGFENNNNNYYCMSVSNKLKNVGGGWKTIAPLNSKQILSISDIIIFEK